MVSEKHQLAMHINFIDVKVREEMLKWSLSIHIGRWPKSKYVKHFEGTAATTTTVKVTHWNGSFFNLQEETRKRNYMLEEATVESQTKKRPLTNTMDIYVQ
jgi:hypothetical protein